jgi:hypothetical protein
MFPVDVFSEKAYRENCLACTAVGFITLLALFTVQLLIAFSCELRPPDWLIVVAMLLSAFVSYFLTFGLDAVSVFSSCVECSIQSSHH